MPPAAQAQASPQTPPQPQDDDAALVALVVAALAAYSTAKALAAALSAPFKAAGIGGAALSAVAALVVSVPHAPVKGAGPASRATTRTNLLRRAQFLLAASRRVSVAVKTARSKNQPAMGAIRDALATEKTYLAAHMQASAGRVQAATAVDAAATRHGNLLGWKSVLDGHTTAECRGADHRNFHADRPPLIGLPGATHPNCRCIPVKPFKGAPVLPSS